MSNPNIDARRSQGPIVHPSGEVSQVFGPQHNIIHNIALERTPLKIDPAELEAAQRRFDHLPLDRIPDLAALHDGSRMPLARNAFFVGRSAELMAVARSLKTADASVCPTVAITGMAGVGKTQLASEFVHRYGQFFGGGVFWFSFADPSAVPSEIAACGSDRMPGLRPAFDRLTPEEQLQEMRAALHSPLPRLLVFDNCEDEELLVRWRPTTGGCRVLLTSRRTHWTGAVGVQVRPLDVLRMPESIALLRNHRPDLTPEHPAIQEIAVELGHLPLALHLAGSFLADYPNSVSPTEYLAQLRSPTLLQHPSLQRTGYSPTSHEQDVGRTFALSYERLDRDNPVDRRARDMLTHAAYLAPGELIEWQLLRATLEPAKTVLLDEDALRRLIDTGLLEAPSDGIFRIHRLLASFVRTTVSDTAVQQAVEQTLVDMAASFKGAKLPKLPAMLVPHLRSAADNALSRGDAQAAQLCSLVAEDLSRNAEYTGARPYYEQALAIREQVLGSDHTDTATSLNDLAELLRQQGEYATARPLYERALAIREQVLGPDHPDTAMSLNDLAGLLRQQGEYATARPLCERALAIRERVLGPDHADTATSLNNLAGLLDRLGDYAAARPLYERALRICERVLGPEHPNTARSLNNLALLLDSLGDYAAARPLCERALAIHERVLGPDHPDTAMSLNNLAGLLDSLGDYAAARPLYERALAIRERVLGPEHPNTATSLNNLAGLLYHHGDYAVARLLCERTLAIYERVLGPEHPDTARSLSNLAELLREQGDYAAAQPLHERALAIRERVLGPDHPDTARSLNNLALLLYNQHDYANAKPKLERALEVYDQVFGPIHPDTFYILSNLAQIHLFHGNRLQVRQYFTRALAVAERHQHIVEKVVRQQLQRQLAQLGGPFHIRKPKPKPKKH